MTLRWQVSYSVGVPVIDEEHKHLLLLIAQFGDLIRGGAHAAAVGQILTELVDYATYHFATEERLMQTTLYPESEMHLLAHAKFSKKIQGFVDEYMLGDTSIGPEISEFLNDWWVQHIIQVDKELGSFLLEKLP